ncbi:MAG: hypothetical protein WC209_11335 [Ignavibacteriaceae bacterium]|jgi:hypothetical protein
MTSSFAKFIANNDDLKRIWKQNSKRKSYTYNKIIKANAAYTREQMLTPLNRIVPDNQVSLIKNFSFEEEIIKAETIAEAANNFFLPSEPVTVIFIFLLKTIQRKKRMNLAFLQCPSKFLRGIYLKNLFASYR